MRTPNLLSILCIFAVLATLLVPDDAEAARRGRRPRYQRRGNTSQCSSYSFKPSPKNVPARAANGRVPFMLGKINQYVTKLKSQCSSLTIHSTFRDCGTNSNVGGASLSRHLCGAAADTSGCGGNSNPRGNISKRVCDQMGLLYINEGSSRFPHCQINAKCNQLRKD